MEWTPTELKETGKVTSHKPQVGMVEAHGSHGADSNGSIFQMLVLPREEYKQGKGFHFILISTSFIYLVL